MNRKGLRKLGIYGKIARQVMARHPASKVHALEIANGIRKIAARSTARPLGQSFSSCDECGLEFDSSLFDDACPDCEE